MMHGVERVGDLPNHGRFRSDRHLKYGMRAPAGRSDQARRIIQIGHGDVV